MGLSGLCLLASSPLPRCTTPLLIALAVLTVLACDSDRRAVGGSDGSRGSSAASEREIAPRFLVGGWVAPKREEIQEEPFAETLRAFVITTQDELTDFLDGIDLLRVRGNVENLNRVDFGREVVLAAYYLWRPLKGDPLSIVGASLVGTEVEIRLELLEDPQGRERPFLIAPLGVVAIDIEQEGLPRGIPLRFVFLVNSEVAVVKEVIVE